MKKITIRGVTLGEGSPKICVPIVGVREEEILEMADAIVRSAAHMAEWRADWYEKAEDNIKVRDLLKKLRQHLKTTPLLVTFRTKAEGGEKAISPEEYEEFCNFVAASAEADLIDVELSMGKERIERIVWEAHAQRKAVILSSHQGKGAGGKVNLKIFLDGLLVLIEEE